MILIIIITIANNKSNNYFIVGIITLYYRYYLNRTFLFNIVNIIGNSLWNRELWYKNQKQIEEKNKDIHLPVSPNPKALFWNGSLCLLSNISGLLTYSWMFWISADVELLMASSPPDVKINSALFSGAN